MKYILNTPIHEKKLKLKTISFYGWTSSWINIVLFVTPNILPMKQAHLTNVFFVRSGKLQKRFTVKTGNHLLLFSQDSCSKINLNIHSNLNVNENFQALSLNGSYIKLNTLSKQNFHSLHSVSYIHLSCFKSWYYLSLPGKDPVIQIESIDTDISQWNRTKGLKLMWIEDQYSKFGFLEHVVPFICNTNLSHLFSYCLGFTILNKENGLQARHIYYLGKQLSMKYRSNKSYHPFSRFTNKLISWVEAEAVCNDVGGHLPYFAGRNDLTTFLALIKLSPNFPPVEAFYLGLLVDTRNVSFNITQFVIFNHFTEGNVKYIYARCSNKYL